MTQVGDAAKVSFEFSEADLDAYAKLSGDANPVHLDRAYAARLGLEDRVVYGGLIVAAVSKLLGEKLPGPGCLWHSLSMEFKAPLYPGRKAEVAGTVSYWSDEHRVLRLNLEVTSGGTLIARGKAQAGVLK